MTVQLLQPTMLCHEHMFQALSKNNQMNWKKPTQTRE